MSRKIDKEEFLKRLDNKFNGNVLLLGEYNGYDNKTIFKCMKCGKDDWEARPRKILEAKQCPKCNKLSKTKTNEQFLKEVNIMYPNGEYEFLEKYITNDVPIKVKHKCGYKYSVTPNNFLRGRKCPKCSDILCSNIITLEIFKQEVYDLVGDEYKILGTEYKNTKTPILMRHELCGKEIDSLTRDNFLHGERCKFCCQNESKAVKEITNYLDENNIKYIREFKFNDCKNIFSLPFDFKIFLNDNNYFLLEYDGIQHFKPVEKFGGEKELIETQKRDKIKNDYCIKNNITLYRMDYKSYIDKTIIKDLEWILNEERSTTSI